MKEELVDLVKSVPNVIGQIYEDLAQPGVKAVGNALGTVLEFSTSILLPLKLHNEKVKLNFTKNLDNYKKKLEEIPEEKRCEVHPQIGTPIIEKLTYTTNEEIADMFTTLLANASNIDMVNTAHPSFVTIIERISPDEARIISNFKYWRDLEYCNFDANIIGGKGYNTIRKHLTLIENYIKLEFPQNASAYFSNLISLGIIKDMEGTYKANETNYNEICQKHGLEQLRQELVPHKYKSIDVEKSFFCVTDFGLLFINACLK